jgi:cardiolipin synthase (CMP-forming)
MDKRIYRFVNGITLYRLLSAPALVVLIFFHRLDLFKWLLLLSFLTDAVDGWLARRFHVSSMLGSRLDSIADDLTIVAAIIGAIVFKLQFLKEEFIWVIILISVYILQLLLALFRYGKISSFHTYGAKAAAVLQGIFLVLLFLLPGPQYFLFYMASVMTIAELIEEIILTLYLPRWQTDVKGLYWVMKRKKNNPVKV